MFPGFLSHIWEWCVTCHVQQDRPALSIQHTNKLLMSIAGCWMDHTAGSAHVSFSHCILPRKVPGLLALPTNTTGQAQPHQMRPVLCLPLQTSPSEGICAAQYFWCAGASPWTQQAVEDTLYTILHLIHCQMHFLFISSFFWIFKRRFRIHYSTSCLQSWQDEELYYSKFNPDTTEGELSVPFLPSHTAQEGWPLPPHR